MESYVDHLVLPDGQDKDGNRVEQWADLLTRLPADRYRTVQIALQRDTYITEQMAARFGQHMDDVEATDAGFADALVAAHLIRGQFVDYLTQEIVDHTGINRCAPEVIDLVAIRAAQLYHDWRVALAGPKAQGQETPAPTESPSDSSANPSSDE